MAVTCSLRAQSCGLSHHTGFVLSLQARRPNGCVCVCVCPPEQCPHSIPANCKPWLWAVCADSGADPSQPSHSTLLPGCPSQWLLPSSLLYPCYSPDKNDLPPTMPTHSLKTSKSPFSQKPIRSAQQQPLLLLPICSFSDHPLSRSTCLSVCHAHNV